MPSEKPGDSLQLSANIERENSIEAISGKSQSDLDYVNNNGVTPTTVTEADRQTRNHRTRRWVSGEMKVTSNLGNTVRRWYP